MLMIFIIFYFIIAIVLSDGGTGTRDVGGDRFPASDWSVARNPAFSLVETVDGASLDTNIDPSCHVTSAAACVTIPLLPILF